MMIKISIFNSKLLVVKSPKTGQIPGFHGQNPPKQLLVGGFNLPLWKI